MEKNILTKGNIIILGEAGAGKTFTLKSILTERIQSDKKILMLEHEGEYKFTVQLGGKIYDNIGSIEYNNKLTTVTLSKLGSNERNIDTILKILDSAIKSGVEIIFIDESFYYLEEAKRLLEYINEQSIELIVCSQFDSRILEDKVNKESFKELFETLIIMPSNRYNYGIYEQLLTLYNIEDIETALELLKNRKRGEVVIIEEQKIKF